MIYHVLPGDAQVEAFMDSDIDGEMLVCRESLIEGDLSGDTLDQFFQNRAAFINETFDEDPAVYNATVASQLRKLAELTKSDDVNLWFEYDLFCAVNIWFCLSLVSATEANVFRVAPVYLTETDIWDGFGGAGGDEMRRSFESRVKLTRDDVELGTSLWDAFKSSDATTLERLSDQRSPAFPYLSEVVEAAINLRSRPVEVVAGIERDGITGFGAIFREFRRRAGVFGFGDEQLKRVLDHRT